MKAATACNLLSVEELEATKDAVLIKFCELQPQTTRIIRQSQIKNETFDEHVILIADAIDNVKIKSGGNVCAFASSFINFRVGANKQANHIVVFLHQYLQSLHTDIRIAANVALNMTFLSSHRNQMVHLNGHSMNIEAFSHWWMTQQTVEAQKKMVPGISEIVVHLPQ